MTKVDVISGFLGAGKTTFIKELINKVFVGEKLVLIENEFGEIGIDGGFLKDAGIEITEMNSGCICCTLVGDFSKALQKVLEEYHPDRVIIEPSGVGKLSDIVKAIEDVKRDADIEISGRITVVDGKKAKMYLKNFGEFFQDQVAHASTIVISRTQSMSPEKIEECVRRPPLSPPPGRNLAKTPSSVRWSMEPRSRTCWKSTIIMSMTMIIAAVMTIITITSMITATTIITITSMITAAVMTITIITQMKCLQAGAERLLTDIRKRSWTSF